MCLIDNLNVIIGMYVWGTKPVYIGFGTVSSFRLGTGAWEHIPCWWRGICRIPFFSWGNWNTEAKWLPTSCIASKWQSHDLNLGFIPEWCTSPPHFIKLLSTPHAKFSSDRCCNSVFYTFSCEWLCLKNSVFTSYGCLWENCQRLLSQVCMLKQKFSDVFSWWIKIFLWHHEGPLAKWMCS